MVNDSLLGIIYEYQRVLLGRAKMVPYNMFTENDASNDKIGIAVIKYAVEEHLHWTPEEMQYKFNRDVIEQMKLEQFVSRVILPPEIEKDDYFYYAARCYPSVIHVNLDELTKIMYNRVKSGQRDRFPAGFFNGADGRRRAVICLRYVLEQYMTFKNKEELYASFATIGGNALLNKYRLYKARLLTFESPVDYLQAALLPEERDDALYYFIKFRNSVPKELYNV